MMNSNRWKWKDAHENQRPLKGLKRSGNADHRLRSSVERGISKSDKPRPRRFTYFGDFDEPSTTILFHVQVESFWLNLQTLGRELLLCLIARLARCKCFVRLLAFSSLKHAKFVLTRIKITAAHVVTLVVLWRGSKRKEIHFRVWLTAERLKFLCNKTELTFAEWRTEKLRACRNKSSINHNYSVPVCHVLWKICRLPLSTLIFRDIHVTLWRGAFRGAFNFPGRKKQKFNARCVCFCACMCVFPAGTFGGAYFSFRMSQRWHGAREAYEEPHRFFFATPPFASRLKVEELLMDFSIFHIKIDGISFLRNCVRPRGGMGANRDRNTF